MSIGIDRRGATTAKTAEVSTTSATVRDGSGILPERFRPFFTVVGHTVCSRHSRSTLCSLAT